MGYSILGYRRDVGGSADDFMGLLDRCLILADVITQNLNDRQLNSLDLTPVHYILAFNHLKATDSLIAAAKLIDSGLIGDAETLARKVLEIAINMKYMSLNMEKRQLQYWYYWTVLSKKTAEHVLSDEGYQDSLRNAMLPFVDEIRSNFRQYVDLFEKDSKGKPNLISWSGLHISDMADKSGLGTEYRICFKLFSASTHGSIDDVLHYFDPEKGVIGPRFESRDALALVHEIARYHIIVTDLVIETFRLDLRQSLDSIRRMLESFRGDPRLPSSLAAQ